MASGAGPGNETGHGEMATGQTSRAGTVSEAHGGQTASRMSPNPPDFQGLGLHLVDPGQRPDHLPELGEPDAHANRASLPTAWNHSWTVNDTAQMQSSMARSHSMANHASHNPSRG
ncbi:hypothetical protein VTN96DRAFT_8419 [Rasamsonia emersonii]